MPNPLQSFAEAKAPPLGVVSTGAQASAGAPINVPSSPDEQTTNVLLSNAEDCGQFSIANARKVKLAGAINVKRRFDMCFVMF
jgi:hypothetical protein